MEYSQDPRYAYLEWLRMQARLLQIELGLGDKGEMSPVNTFAHSFHFPPGQDWHNLPQPSTRAEQVLRAAGQHVPMGLLVAEDAV